MPRSDSTGRSAAAAWRPGVSCTLVFFVLLLLPNAAARAQDAGRACTAVAGRFISVEGTVRTITADSKHVRSVKAGLDVCTGDTIQVGPNSRAAFRIPPETVVRLDQNTVVSIVVTKEDTEVRFQSPGAAIADKEQSYGAAHFVARFPRKLRIKTPFVNAAIEGTEFEVALHPDATEVGVIEGLVRLQPLYDSSGEVAPLQSGQLARVGSDGQVQIAALIKPADMVQWALYYPPMSDLGSSFDQVLEVPCAPGMSDERDCLVREAENLLRVGRAKEALATMDRLLRIHPDDPDALALKAVIAVVTNQYQAGLDYATLATKVAPNSYRAWLALSYVQQAQLKLVEALQSAERAQRLSSESPVAQMRVAELRMSLGRIEDAKSAALSAVATNANDARAHVVLGFVLMASSETKKAQAEFESAIQLDSSDPLAHLGLGLAYIRQGHLDQGVAQLEAAVILNPTNALLRSYLGKGYFEQNTSKRDQLAKSEYDLAKLLDPYDPTPWLYEAILLYSQNNPVEALDSLEESIELNGNRAVYRSQLLLDEDQAARTSAIASIYDDLNFGARALVEGTVATVVAPDNSSAHRFLADAYLSVPRHEIASQSELLQAQLRQPLTLTPLQPQLTADRFVLLKGAGPADLGTSDFNRLFVRDGVAAQISGLVGGNETLGDQVVLSALKDKLSIGLAQLHYQTDGFRENNDHEKNIYDAFAQYQFSQNTSAQVEFRRSSTTEGDIVLRFDPETFFPDRHQLDTDSTRIGFHHRFDERFDIVASGIYVDSKDSITEPNVPGAFSQAITTYVAELQGMFRTPTLDLIPGVGYVDDSRDIDAFGFPSQAKTTGSTAYLYTYLRPRDLPIKVQLGLSFASLEHQFSDTPNRDQWNPKLGVIWNPTLSTTVRAAYFRALKMPFFAGQTIEPTQLAGFNQFFDDLDGTSSTRYGLGIDQKLSSRAFVGGEISRRLLSVPQEGVQERFQWDESLASAYLYWAPNRSVGLSFSYIYESFTRPQDFPGQELFVDVKTQRVPMSVLLIGPVGLSMSFTTTYVRQEGKFFSFATGSDPFAGSDDFWVTDFALNYRLPRRLGVLSFQVRNLFDQQFKFQETDLVTTTFARRRLVLFQAVLNL